MRTAIERKNHALKLLTSDKQDVWVATADHQARPHLVPLSLGWDGQNVIVTTEADSRTARNLQSSTIARLAVGDTRDVVIIDVDTKLVSMSELDSATADAFAARNGWDPRHARTQMIWLIMTPQRILVWNSEAELQDRTTMREGRWLG